MKLAAQRGGGVPAADPRDKRQAMEARALFEILVRENADSVRAFLLASVRNPATAEELLQETFLAAWSSLARYDRQLPFGPWVRSIAGKLLLAHRRRAGRSTLYYCDEVSLGLLDAHFTALQSVAGDTFGEKLDTLRHCLALLSEPQQHAIALHYEHGLHCKEIGPRLGLGLEAVKRQLQRGRAALLRCLRHRMDPELLEGAAKPR